MVFKAIGSALGLGPQKTSRTTTSTPTRPTEVAGAVSDLISRARTFADQPFEAYGQPRIAGFTPDELAGFEAARGVAATSGALAPLTSDLVREGVAASRGLATRLPETDLSGYMSPYTEAVLAPALRDIEERATQERLRLGQQSARTGSFGGSRQAISEAELEGRTQRSLGDLSARERANAYNQALAQFRIDQERIPALFSGALGQVGTGLAQTNQRLGTEVNPLLQVGGAQRALTQAELDFARQQFEEERDFPLRGIEVLRSVANAPAASLGIGTTGTTTTTEPGRNPLTAIGGSILGGGGGGPIGGALSAFGNTLGLSFLGGGTGGGPGTFQPLPTTGGISQNPFGF
jgi:hypothetical protein